MTGVALSGQDFEGIKKINGAKLYFSIKGKGENLVVVHGGPGLNHSYLKPHLIELEKKFRVIYYDQRANGQSWVPAADSISFKFLANDLEAIRRELNVEKLNILAHSWGVIPVIHYALAYPGRVNKFIMSNPALLSREFDRDVMALLTKRTSKADSAQRVQLRAGPMDKQRYESLMLLTFRSTAYDPTNMSKLALNIPANFAAANQMLFSGLMKDPAAQANLYDSLDQLNFPVLVIHGDADVTPGAVIERLKTNLPKAEHVMFRQSGHFPFIEENKKYIDTVITFLRTKK